jgi:hypothetical protein
MFTPIAALFSALRYELTRLLTTPSTRATALLSVLSSALITLLAARRAVGLAHSRAAEVVRPGGGTPKLDRTGAVAMFGRGATTAPGDAVMGHTVAVPAVWSPHGSGTLSAAVTAVSHTSASAVAGGSGLGHPARSLAAMLGAHAGGAGVVAGGVVGAILPATMAALGAAWVGASSIAEEYRYDGALLSYVLVPRRGAVLLAKAIAAAVFGALLCFGTTLAAFGTARLGFTATGTRIAVPSALMVPAVREITIAALCGALAVPACAVLRMRLLAAVAASGLGAIVASRIPGSASPLIHPVSRAGRLVVGDVRGASVAALMVTAAALWWAAGLVAVRHRRVD